MESNTKSPCTDACYAMPECLTCGKQKAMASLGVYASTPGKHPLADAVREIRQLLWNTPDVKHRPDCHENGGLACSCGLDIWLKAVRKALGDGT